jgi:hypothetical protein
MDMRNTYRILVGKPERKKPLGRPRWRDNIKMDLGEVEWEGVNWISLTYNRSRAATANTVMSIGNP